MRVLVALDASPVSLHAARTAANLFSGQATEYLVVNATRSYVPWVADGPFGGVWLVDPRVWTEQDRTVTTEQRAEIADESAQAGLEGSDLVIEPGEPADVIARAAEMHDVDVIVIGSHNKGFVRRLWDPSVSSQVVHQTRRPVLIVSDSTEP